MSHPVELYACIYVRELPAQALLRLRPELHDKPCVVMEGEPPAEMVCALNTRARLLGFRRGMTKVEVETFENVIALQRSPKTEAMVSRILLECAGAFSPRIEDRSTNGLFVCGVDVAGTESLFGLPLMLAKQIRQRIRSVGIVAAVTISANLHTSVCLARGLSGGVALRVVPRGEEAKALASLPVTVLDVTQAQSETFSTWGIRSVGAIAALPERALIARLGQDAKRLLQLAQGKHPHLLQPIDVPFVLEEQAELDSPLDDLDSLLFGVSTMLEQLILRARSRVFALASVTITLRLDGGGTHARTVNPRVPTNDKKLWLKLLHLDLQNHPPQASILAVHLQAEPGETSKVQLGLFSPQLPEPGKLDVVLAKITAIVGEGNVGMAVLDDTRRLGDFHMEPFAITTAEPPLPNENSTLCLRLLRPPERTRVELRCGQPCAIHFRSRCYMVDRLYGPWLKGGDWWNESIWGNEQWDVIGKTTDGSLLVCRLSHDFILKDWCIVGLYD
ncbi:DNA polymerase Y family protein [Terriglobus sp. ADX1]|uniref:DNA polymerase Y family protein n=1 Tax=Terriglobus sp. ADX1 TaxID=2794063 RepID=UPI002FE5B753